MTCFPRLYAAASLKHEDPENLLHRSFWRFPRLYAAASLKQPGMGSCRQSGEAFSAALCRGLIEAPHRLRRPRGFDQGFPRLYAAASLKPLQLGDGLQRRDQVFRGFMPRPH